MTPRPWRPDGPLLVATGNPGKIREIRQIVADAPFEVALPGEVGLTWESPEETGTTYAENAVLKAASVGIVAGRAAIGEDAGLEVDALGGAPGLYSKRYGPDTAARNARLLRELGDRPDRGARFVCVLALWIPGRPPRTFRGELRGRIGRAARGDGGFGYDPLFVPETQDASLAELPPAYKLGASHRARALAQLVAWSRGEVVG